MEKTDKKGSSSKEDKCKKHIFFKQKTTYEVPQRLVGSEMGIRDRGSRTWAGDQKLELGPKYLGPGPSTCPKHPAQS